MEVQEEVKKTKEQATKNESKTLLVDIDGNQVVLGSRKVTLRPRTAFGEELLPDDIAAEVTKRIGSTWVAGTRDILRGLSKSGELRYLPSIIGVAPGSNDWEREVRTYWEDFSVFPPSGGIELEIGFEKSSDVIEVNATNKNKYRYEIGTILEIADPINIYDYITYSFCEKHYDVAVSKEELDNKELLSFYIEDRNELMKEEEKSFDARQKSMKKFFILTSDKQRDESVLNWLLEYYYYTHGKTMQERNLDYSNMSSKQKDIRLETIAREDPVVFFNLASDENLQYRALLIQGVKRGVITKEGNSYFDGDDLLGSSELAAIAKLKSPEFSGQLIKIQERIKM